MTRSLTQGIETVEKQYPQIYAYTLPTLPSKEGWIKIGETTRKDVNERIIEQLKTAAFDFSKDYHLEWYKPAFKKDGSLFSDHALHRYYQLNQIERERDSDQHLTEWFYFNGYMDKAYTLFDDFIHDRYSGLNLQEVTPYDLREEQAAAVEMTLEAIDRGEEEFLWNAKPRFGKTLSAYDLMKRMDAINVLVVTNRPAIANSWFDDYEKFVGAPYYFVSESPSLKDRHPISRELFMEEILFEDMEARQINFVSLQDLKGSIYFGGYHKKLGYIADMTWDLLIIDEAHEGIDTYKTDLAFDEIKRKFTLHLSGTPFKALAAGKFHDDQIFNWTYEDEQAKKLSWDHPEEKNPYEDLPKMSMFTYKLSDMIIDKINQGANLDEDHTTDYMFDLNEFFSTKNNGDFTYEAEVGKFLDSLTTHEKFPFSTPELRRELKHTFWLLNRVDSARALKKMLEAHPVFENYKILLAVGSDQDRADLAAVRQAIQDHERTITLSVGQLTTGVTIPEWTGVMMLSNMKSPALYMQAAFRAQNPWIYREPSGQTYRKKNAYVFDFAPERTLIIFDEFANNLGQGGSRLEDKQENIKELLNFFPVIGEDSEGRMVELDATQVLTIPKTIKSQEVVRSGFMNNFLFANIGGIFQSQEAREILELLHPEKEGRKQTTNKPIEVSSYVQDKLDEDGEVQIDEEIIINKSQAIFGDKVYAEIESDVFDAVDQGQTHAASTVARNISNKIFDDQEFENLRDEYQFTARIRNNIKRSFTEAVESVVREEEDRYAISQAHIQRRLDDELKEATSEQEEEALKEQADRDREVAYDDYKQKMAESISDQVMNLQEETVEEQEVIKVNQEKKSTEDDVRARLRGFARTIPSFLMAYGTPDIRLSNFDQLLPDHVFQEVTGITLDQFRTLRDTYEFFDEVVFDESVQEFLRTKERLANYFEEDQEEDIFDYIPNQETNQIFTPKWVVEMMVDQLEEENPGIFEDPTKTFADLYMKSGLYLTEIVKRLYVGLKDVISDEQERLKHILEKQVYGLAPSEIIYGIVKSYIFGFDERAKQIDESHVQYLDAIPYAKGETEDSLGEELSGLFKLEEEGDHSVKFDVVVGNPPYQQETDGKYTANGQKRVTSIFPAFQLCADEIAQEYSCLIYPGGRWIHRSGKGMKKFGLNQINDPQLSRIIFFRNANEIFEGIGIADGISIVIKDYDKNEASFRYDYHDGDEYITTKLNSPGKELIALNPQDGFIINKIEQVVDKLNIVFLHDSVAPQKLFQVESDFVEKNPDKVVLYEGQDFDSNKTIKLFTNDKAGKAGRGKWFLADRKLIEVNQDLIDKWQVVVSSANAGGQKRDNQLTIIDNKSAFGRSRVALKSFNTAEEAENFYKYVETDLVKFAFLMTDESLTSLAKKVPDFVDYSSENKFLNFKEDLNIQLAQLFDLSETEIEYIKNRLPRK